MKKIGLDVASLEVTSFEPAAAEAQVRGTVKGHVRTQYPNETCGTCGETCQMGSCAYTCDVGLTGSPCVYC
ncbi:MAG TPA: hypothetical protein VFJ16_02475 [Longimicrobium sp.]|nr:hypothetical protein [Longimicrobium sp.]